jgi:hypothetical protein
MAAARAAGGRVSPMQPEAIVGIFLILIALLEIGVIVRTVTTNTR